MPTSLRARQLQAAADAQITELAEQLSASGPAGLGKPCPGRAKLGDGTVGAVAAHTIENYVRIGRFVAATRSCGRPPQADEHCQAHRDSGVEPEPLLIRLTSARDAMAVIGELSDHRLDSVPPEGAIRFADGVRTLEQVVASLLRHQRHQVGAVASAVT